MKLSRAIQGYWLEKRLNLSSNTIIGYEVIFRRFVEFLNDAEMDRITSNDVREFLFAYLPDEHKQRTSKSLGKKTVANAWIALSSLWSWAATELGVPHIIKGKVKIPKFNKKAIEPYTQGEIKRMVAAARYTKAWETRTGKRTQTKRPTADRDAALILTLLDTGIRAQELCDLTIADYDEKRGRLHIKHGKGDKGRFVIMGNRARKALWKYLETREDTKPIDPLFATKTGQHLQRDNLRHTLQIIGEQAEVEEVFVHKFRHTFAINFLRNGGSIALLKELLGHESVETVLIYAKIADQDIDDGAKYSVSDNWRL
jgi:integrase/recombinase XerD